MKNKILVGLLLSLTLVLAVSMVTAVTIDTPATSSVLAGTVGVNVTNATITEMLNCTVYASSPSTANSTAVAIATGTNASASTSWINMSADTTAIEDSNDYTIYVTCWNATESATSSSLTSMTIDNTVPTAPSSLSPSTTQTSSSVTFSATVVGSATTGCTLAFSGVLPGSVSSQAMTHTGNTCTTTLSAVPDQTYTYTITASDGTNSTASSSQQVSVDTAPSSNYVPPEELVVKGGDGDSPLPTILLILGCVIVAWFMLKK